MADIKFWSWWNDRNRFDGNGLVNVSHLKPFFLFLRKRSRDSLLGSFWWKLQKSRNFHTLDITSTRSPIGFILPSHDDSSRKLSSESRRLRTLRNWIFMNKNAIRLSAFPHREALRLVNWNFIQELFKRERKFLIDLWALENLLISFHLLKTPLWNPLSICASFHWRFTLGFDLQELWESP